MSTCLVIPEVRHSTVLATDAGGVGLSKRKVEGLARESRVLPARVVTAPV